MSQILTRHPRKLMAGGILIASTGAYVFHDRLGLPNPFYTPGVQNIEKRYSSGGGTASHLPGAASKLGDHESQVGNLETSKGVGSPYYQEHYGGQKAEPSGFDKQFNQMNFKQDKGK